jgi:uncharacterized protein YuzE
MGKTVNLKIHYDAETDTLSLWNGNPASEADDVADNLIADFDDDGEVVGFTLEHAAELLGTDFSSSKIALHNYNAMNGMSVLDKFKDAFQDLYKFTESNHTISFCQGATVYFRTTRQGPNTARIHAKYLKNFPNARQLESYMKRYTVPIDPSPSHPDYLIGPEHADRVIAILGGQRSL